MEVSGQLYKQAALSPRKDPPGTYLIGGRVDSIAGVDALEIPLEGLAVVPERPIRMWAPLHCVG
jgi:hypothetical protein